MGRGSLAVDYVAGGVAAPDPVTGAMESPDAEVARVVTLGSPICGDPRQNNNVWRFYEWVAGHAVDAPPVAVQLHALKHRKWRPLGAPVALPRKPDPWPLGERRTVRVPLPPAVPPDRIAVALATDVQWHSSLLPCAGASEKRPFPVLADLAARP